MKAKDIMTVDVEVISPQATLTEAAQKMKDLNIGDLPVCDGDRLLGMITDRDITIRATAQGLDPNSTRTYETMTPGVVYCFDDQDVKEVAQVMSQNKIRRLPILNRDKRMVGIVSLGDVSVETGNQKMSGKSLGDISKPDFPNQ